MDQQQFQETAERFQDMMIALDAGAAPGRREFYNAYWKGTEVVVLGYTWKDPDGHSYTKPLAILVDDEVFKAMHVDQESGRVEDGNLEPPKVV